ncbi:MAG TPA: hypothetical protein DEH25_02955 [Chloroflexi bacterium]|nr:hypothetical protein [Chloroflexota bacterium]
MLIFLAAIVWLSANAASLPPDNSTSATPPPDAETQIINEVEDAIQAAIRQDRGASIAFFAGGVTIQNTQVSESGEWAVSYLIPTDPQTGEPVPTEPGLTVAQQTRGEWDVWLPTSEGWSDMLTETPEDILSFDQKAMWLTQYNEAAVNVPSATLRGYLLPWDDGITRYLSTSVCHDSYITSGNAHYAYDFYTSKTMWDILAIKGGTVQIARWSVPNGDDTDMGNYIVIRDVTTSPVTYHLYMHLAQDSIPPELRLNGAPVVQGQFLGIADDTGASTGHHLHLQVQVPLYGENYYWGRSVDFAFNDVDINQGHPRINASYCHDPLYCKAGDICDTFRSSYTSQNIRIGTEDNTPPEGDLRNPLTGETYAATLPLEAWARDLGDPGKNPVGIESARFIAYYNGAWREVGPAFTSENFNYEWDWCAAGVPEGPVSVALRLRDFRGNQTPGLPGLRHVTKHYDCNAQPIPNTCRPTSSQVALFSEINFQGVCQTLGLGDYASGSLFGPVGNDGTYSILVGSGVQAELFTDNNFTGRTETIRANDANLGENPTASGTLSSLKVSTRTTGFTANPQTEPGSGLVNRNPSPATVNTVNAPYFDDFESDSSSWTTTNILWNVSEAQANSPTHSWRYGFDATNNYNDGTANSGSLTSPLINLPVSASPYVLEFRYRYQTESRYAHWDQRWVQISVDGGQFLNAYQLSSDPMSGWMKARIELLPMLGDMGFEHTLQVRFNFRTLDSRNNNFEGWFIDNFQVQAEPITACPTDNNEVNDAPAQATAITYGSTLHAAICPDWDVDYYKFNGSAGDQILVDIDAKSQGSELDGYLFLLDSDGTSELAESDDEVAYELQDPLLGYVLTRDGQYHLKMQAWDFPSGTGEYTLTLITESQNPSIHLTYPQENGGLRRGLVTLTAEASDPTSGIHAVRFWFHTDDWLSSDWVELPVDIDGTDGWSAPLDTSGFAEGDTLSVYVRAFDGAGNWAYAAAWQVVIDSKAPTISLSPLTNPSNSTALQLKWQASDVGTGVDYVVVESKVNNGAWETAGEEAVFRDYWFVGAPGNSYAFRATVYDRAGNSATSTTVNSSIPVINTLCSAPDAWDASAADNDNDYQNATLIAAGFEPQEHNFCNPAADDRLRDVDWLKFMAEGGKKYVFVANPAGSSAGVVIRLYAANGTTLLAESSPPRFGQPTTLSWESALNATLYVKLEHVNGSVAGNGVSYRVSLADKIVYLPLINR